MWYAMAALRVAKQILTLFVLFKWQQDVNGSVFGFEN